MSHVPQERLSYALVFAFGSFRFRNIATSIYRGNDGPPDPITM
jgi:hypothetical protein